MISPRFAYQGRQGRQLSQTICYKQAGPAKSGVSNLSGIESHTLCAATVCGSSDTATESHSQTQPLPQKKQYFHQTTPESQETLCPAGAWSALLTWGALSQTVWGWTFHNILSFMPQMPLDTTKGYEWKEKAGTIKSSWGRDSVSSSPFPKLWHTEGRRARKALKCRTLNHRYFESLPATQKLSPQPHFPSPTSW